MDVSQVELTGTVGADGTLVLDGPVRLEPGRVKVVVETLPLVLPEGGSFLERMQAIWDAQDARGYVPRSAEEFIAELRKAREEWGEREAMRERIRKECVDARNAATAFTGR